jgi:hypothetical protein
MDLCEHLKYYIQNYLCDDVSEENEGSWRCKVSDIRTFVLFPLLWKAIPNSPAYVFSSMHCLQAYVQ